MKKSNRLGGRLLVAYGKAQCYPPPFKPLKEPLKNILASTRFYYLSLSPYPEAIGSRPCHQCMQLLYYLCHHTLPHVISNLAALCLPFPKFSFYMFTNGISHFLYWLGVTWLVIAYHSNITVLPCCPTCIGRYLNHRVHCRYLVFSISCKL